MVIQCVNILQTLGYAVKGANGGETAMALLASEPFDLALVDYRMPGMTGFEVFQQARMAHPELPMILVTGHGSSDVIEDAMALGFTAVLIKPFLRDQLRQVVETALALASR